MYMLSISGSLMGDLEYERLCWSGESLDLYLSDSKAAGNSDSLLLGSCKGLIDLSCWGSGTYNVSFTILVIVAVSIAAGSSSSS